MGWRRNLASWLCLVAAARNYAFAFKNPNTTVGSCATQWPPQNLPFPSCPASKKTLEDARALAHKVAPILHFHPLEPYYLEDMDVWFRNATLYLPDSRVPGNSTFDFIFDSKLMQEMWLPRSFTSRVGTVFPDDDIKQHLLAGAGFDEQGHSKARVFYTVKSLDEGTWLYSFNLFYSWNGCSNQIFALNLNGTIENLQYLMCPTGVHEADLERISMLVCKEDGRIRRTAYSQHSWMEVRDCDADQCNLVTLNNETHPVSHAGLEGHGNYYEAAPFMVYDYFNGSKASEKASLENFGGIYIGDRTFAQPNKSFVPTKDNIVYLPLPDEIYSQNLTEFDWALYPGNWGAGSALSLPDLNFTCLYDNQTRLGNCNETEENAEATNLLKVSLNLLGGTNFLGDYDGTSYSLKNSTNSTVGYPSLTGPLFRQYTYTWMAEQGAPLWKSLKTKQLTCPANLTELQPLPNLKNYDNGISTLIEVLWGICLGAFLFSVVMALMFMLPVLLSKSEHMQVMMTRKLGVVKAKAGEAYDAALEKSESAWGALASKFRSKHGKDNAAGVQLSEEEGSGDSIRIQQVPDEEAPAGKPSSPKHTVREGEEQQQQQLARTQSVVSPRDVSEDLDLRKRVALWGLLGIGLFVAGYVLASLGLNVFWTNSVATFASDLSGQTGIMKTLRILLGSAMILILLCDIAAFFVIFLARPKYLVLGKYIRIRNYLGSHDWLTRHNFNLHIVALGLIIICVNISAILFALGFIIVVATVIARVACSTISKINVEGLTVNEVCVSIPNFSDEPICGWNALQLCYNVSSMGVINLVIGGAMLIWCHLVWLIMLMRGLWRFYNFVVEVEKDFGSEPQLQSECKADREAEK